MLCQKGGVRNDSTFYSFTPANKIEPLALLVRSLKMKHRVLILATACLMLTGYFAVNTCAQGHTIRGKVRNSGGTNVSHVSVILEKNGTPIDQTVSNNEGDFIFSGLTDTSYTLVASAAGYNNVSESVDFVRATGPGEPGETRTIEITLVPTGGVRPPRPGLSFVQEVPKAARDAFDSGLKFARENRTADAISAYETAIKIFPDYFDARLVLANEVARQNKFPEAIKHLDAARRVNPKDDRVYDLFARVMMQQRKYAVAARIYAEAAQLNPNEPQYLVAEGTALVEQAAATDPSQSKTAADERTFAFAEAERVLNAALKLNKKLGEAHLQLARLYEKRGERSRAADELEQYLRNAANVKNADAIRDAIKKLRS
jgi:cytochrome c-type biogenesis protein CcmH/NrfG